MTGNVIYPRELDMTDVALLLLSFTLFVLLCCAL